jgi:hypothetical protein
MPGRFADAVVPATTMAPPGVRATSLGSSSPAPPNSRENSTLEPLPASFSSSTSAPPPQPAGVGIVGVKGVTPSWRPTMMGRFDASSSIAFAVQGPRNVLNTSPLPDRFIFNANAWCGPANVRL